MPANDLTVFITSAESTCDKCGTELGRDVTDQLLGAESAAKVYSTQPETK